VVMSGLPGDPSTNSSGYYSATIDHGWSGTVTPHKSGYSFDPTNRMYSNVVSNQYNQDYVAIWSYILHLPLILRWVVSRIVCKFAPSHSRYDPYIFISGSSATCVRTSSRRSSNLWHTFKDPHIQVTMSDQPFLRLFHLQLSTTFIGYFKSHS